MIYIDREYANEYEILAAIKWAEEMQHYLLTDQRLWKSYSTCSEYILFTLVWEEI